MAMRKVLLFLLLLLLLSTTVHGQYENRLQPDSVYKRKKVKKIIRRSQFVVKDASTFVETIYFDREGYKIRSVFYSEPYDFGEKLVTIGPLRIEHYQYDSAMKVIQIVDSIGNLRDSYIENSFLYYDSIGRLTKSLYHRRHRYTPIQETFHYYAPRKSVTVQRNDTIGTYHGTTEFERGFYVKSVFGHNRAPKSFYEFAIDEQDTANHKYSDNELYTFNFNKVFANKFDSRGRLKRSDINDDFNNETTNYKLKYQYYRNGLIKCIRGYVTADYFTIRGYATADYFKYEFFE